MHLAHGALGLGGVVVGDGAIVFSYRGQSGAAVLTIVLAGATLGFLFFNFPPASNFA